MTIRKALYSVHFFFNQNYITIILRLISNFFKMLSSFSRKKDFVSEVIAILRPLSWQLVFRCFHDGSLSYLLKYKISTLYFVISCKTTTMAHDSLRALGHMRYPIWNAQQKCQQQFKKKLQNFI